MTIYIDARLMAPWWCSADASLGRVVGVCVQRGSDIK